MVEVNLSSSFGPSPTNMTRSSMLSSTGNSLGATLKVEAFTGVSQVSFRRMALKVSVKSTSVLDLSSQSTLLTSNVQILRVITSRSSCGMRTSDLLAHLTRLWVGEVMFSTVAISHIFLFLSFDPGYGIQDSGEDLNPFAFSRSLLFFGLLPLGSLRSPLSGIFRYWFRASRLIKARCMFLPDGTAPCHDPFPCRTGNT